jgi:hypothetical protein
MKFRILLLALVTALLGASVALAGNPGSKPDSKPGKPTTGPNCKPKVKVILKGTLESDPAESDTSLLMHVTKANRHGRAYLTAPQPVMILVDAKTKVRRKAPDSEPTKTLDSLALGDIAKLGAKACKAELRNGGTPELTARHLKARPPAPSP